MKTVTAAVTPEPEPEPEPGSLDARVAKVLRYANNKRTKAKRGGQVFRAAFWTGFRRSFARRWYSH